MKASAYIVMLSFLAGCAPSVTPYTGQKQVIRSYELGQPLSANVGQPIVVVHSTSTAPAYIVTADYTPPQHDSWKGGLDYPPLTKGMRFTKIADRSDGMIGISNPAYTITIPGGMIRQQRKEPVTLWISPSGVVSTTMEGAPWKQDPLFRHEEDEASEESTYGAELVYNGMSGNILQTSYREHLNGSEEKTATTPLQFDLDKGPMISFKSIRIQVMKASPDSLSYKVISDDNLPWMQ